METQKYLEMPSQLSNRDKTSSQNKALKKLNKIEEKRATIGKEEQMLLYKLERLNKKKQFLNDKYINIDASHL